jgi:hypothetical protein
MPLNLRSNSGAFVPFVKYNAKSGRFSARFQGVQGDVDLPLPIRLAFDFEHIQTGWIRFNQQGGPPDVLWDPTLVQEAEAPSDKHRRGFRVLVYGTQQAAGAQNERIGLREIMANSAIFIEAINAMYGEYEAGQVDRPDQLPVFQCTRTESIKGVHGINYRPVFTLERWVERAQIPGLDDALAIWKTQHSKPATSIHGEPDEGTYSDDPAYVDDDIPF